ncbi:hypothetical protein OEZ85_008312 [Tetradesmus obliquus]|uniref:Uncharacterized protein n=1 Tax=Tetradesmus obliquus TaxID=3088 RepID=A0ABY8TIT7_TETOB|nr:hypothetical protein OEZ85_008312 [Tetradesmus obliquus]
MVLLSRPGILASVPEEEEGPREQQQPKQQQMPPLPDSFTNQSISRRVRDDIKQVLVNSWELRELNRTAPRASQATLEWLALPRRARIQQQVNCGLHDVTDFARWKAAQLAKRRKAEQLAAQQQQQLAAAEREALQGWHRQKEQLGEQLHEVRQQQLMQRKELARRSAAAATQQAKADLQLLKEQQERRRLHAAALKERLTATRIDTRLH